MTDLDKVIRANAVLQQRVEALEKQYADLQNELSLLTSLQRVSFDLEKRVAEAEGKIERIEQEVDSEQRPTFTPPPQPPRPFPVPFGSASTLVRVIETMFDCRNGDYRGYHTVLDERTGHASHYTYNTLGAVAAGDGAPERLREELYAAFIKLHQSCPSKHPVLYWRHAAPERIQEEKAEGTDIHKIRVRVAIPGADFSVIGPLAAEEGTRFHSLGKMS